MLLVVPKHYYTFINLFEQQFQYMQFCRNKYICILKMGVGMIKRWLAFLGNVKNILSFFIFPLDWYNSIFKSWLTPGSIFLTLVIVYSERNKYAHNHHSINKHHTKHTHMIQTSGTTIQNYLSWFPNYSGFQNIGL